MHLTRKAIVVSSIVLFGTGIVGGKAISESAPARPHPCESTSLKVGTYVRLPDASRGHIVDLAPAGRTAGYIAIADDGGWTDFIRECDVYVVMLTDEAIDTDPL